MKKTALFLMLFFVSAALAEVQAPYAQVELVSGTKQKAQFLGIANDTVSLGGYIKNKFTVVKLHKSQFKSIVGEDGTDLLNLFPAKPDSTTADTTARIADSAASGTADSTATADSAAIADSSAQAPVADANGTPKADSGTEITHKLFLGFETAVIPQHGIERLDAFAFALLQELDSTFKKANIESAPGCSDRACLQEFWKDRGERDMFFGKVSHAKHPDSVVLEITRAFYEEELPTIYRSAITVSRSNMLQDMTKDGSATNLAKELLGLPVQKKLPRSYIHVETDPESATISRPEKDAICKSPCTFAVTDTGKIEIDAYWTVDQHLWGAQTFVRPLPGDTTKVSLKLKRITPEIKIVSNPVGAEIFPGQGEITRSSESIGTTPQKFSLTTPGMAYMRLRKEGYRDTLVQFFVAPVPEINLDIALEHLTDFDEVRKQQDWQRERNKTRIGKILMGSSVAPAIIGALFLYLAQQDYDEAEDIKDALKMPSAAKGENFNAKIKKNKDLVDSGDKKNIIGGSLIGAGAVLFGLGFFLTF